MFDTYDYIIIALMIYLFFSKKNKEGMDNTENNLEKNIKNKINEIYKTDLEPIRKLGRISYRLYNNAGIEVPGNLELRGNLKINDKQLILGNKNLDYENIIYHGDQVQLYNQSMKGRIYNSGKRGYFTKDKDHSTTKFQIEKCGQVGIPPFFKGTSEGQSMCQNKLF